MKKRPKKTYFAIAAVVVLLLIYHITRPIWLGYSYDNFVDMSIKFVIDFLILFIAWTGAKQNRKKRNQYILLILVFYLIGDMITSYSVIPAAFPYAVGHILLIMCSIQTCNIKRWQYVLGFILAVCEIPVLILVNHILPELTLPLCILTFIYGLILISKFCLSLTNRFFHLAAICFLLGDVFGFARISVFTQLTPVLDYTFYVAAMALYGLSTYNCSRKEVVCYHDVAVLNKALAKTEVKYFISGKWSGNLFLHRFLRQSAKIELLYNMEQSEPFFDALNAMHYQLEEDTSGINIALYSEKLGYLQIKGIKILPDNNIVYSEKNGHDYILDPEFVHILKRGNGAYPCIFPLDENDPVLKSFQEKE